MDWTAIAAVSGLVQTAVVVASLWYVARQLHKSTEAMVASARQNVLDADLGLISDYITYTIDPHLIGDDVKLSPEDERRMTWILVKAIRIREWAWHQYRAGGLDEDSWQSYMAPVPGLFSTARARRVLEFYTGNDEFIALLKARVPIEPATV